MTLPVEIAAGLSGLSDVAHGFFGRNGGASSGEFSSLNCSLRQGDDPGAVNANRAACLAAIGATGLAISKQVHSAQVCEVTAPFAEPDRPDADGMVTDKPGLALGILTADCVPVLLCDPEARIIGACHAGWRGALAGIVDNTIAAMIAAGASPDRIRAAIGPAIGAANYEVGPDWAAAQLERDSAHRNYLFVPPGGREHFDLPRFVLDRLADAGIAGPEQVGGDTFAEPDRYFSHRFATKDGARTGRQLAVIALRG